MKWFFPIVILFIFSYSPHKKNQIEIPTEAHFSSEFVLRELENAVEIEPNNERLIHQQLYFCEQLDWPLSCEKVLKRAKSRWGLTEKLIDQFVTYYLQYEEYEMVESMLTGVIETRSRLEARISIATNVNRTDFTYLERYLQQYGDSRAHFFAASRYLERGDTLKTIDQFEKLLSKDSSSALLKKYYPMLMNNDEFKKALEIIEHQLAVHPADLKLRLDKAICQLQLGSNNPALSSLRRLGTPNANLELHRWYRNHQQWDSSLLYLDKLRRAYPDDISFILAKAEILEAKGWITYSLPYYERVFLSDTTDSKMAYRLEIVRRKVAYLRQIKETKNLPATPTLERKTIGNQ